MFKKIIFSFLIGFNTFVFSQFGFTRMDDIEVVKDGILQKYPWVGGMDYCQFSSIDLDFDGVEDLFVFDRTCNKVLTFLQKGGAGETDYVYAPAYEKNFPPGLHDWALLVDYDCDGLKDIFTYQVGGASVFRNVGNAIDGNSFDMVNPILKTKIYGGTTYMYLSAQDIPAIVDVDGDGDMDILGFGVLGTAVEYHKNMSMELYGVCDSLVFETKNICWGRFRESASSNEVTLWDTLAYPCDEGSLGLEFAVKPTANQDRHSGSTVLALDMNNSGVLDLILGDITFNNLTLLLNSGTEVNMNSGMDAQDNTFPSSSKPVDLPLFPAAFHVDINNDNKRDLLVSPASRTGAQNIKSVWMYENKGADLEPDFIYQTENFLQGGMIDVGSTSFPVFFDHNGDGLMDLLVSSQGQYNPISGNQISKIAYYENIGTVTVPKFKFITDDYQGLSSKGLGSSLVFYPTFGDLDGDGDLDMIIGEYTGYCFYIENTGGPGNSAIFNTFEILKDNTGTPIFAGTYAYPQLVDLDRNGVLDLVIGRRSGKLQYFKNIGSSSDYNFQLTSANLGNVDVSGEGFIEGQAVPVFIDIKGSYKLLVGSKIGNVYFYDNIDGNLEGNFNLVESTLDKIDIGTFSAPAVYNLRNNNRLQMALGNKRGGVVMFESAEINDIGIHAKVKVDFKVYPNPASTVVYVDMGAQTTSQLEQYTISIINAKGQVFRTIKPVSSLVEIACTGIAKGTYFVQVIESGREISTVQITLQ